MTLNQAANLLLTFGMALARTRQINKFPAFGFGDRHVLAAECRSLVLGIRHCSGSHVRGSPLPEGLQSYLRARDRR